MPMPLAEDDPAPVIVQGTLRPSCNMLPVAIATADGLAVGCGGLLVA